MAALKILISLKPLSIKAKLGRKEYFFSNVLYLIYIFLFCSAKNKKKNIKIKVINKKINDFFIFI